MTFDAELREITEHIAAPLQDSRAATESAFVFRVGNEWFALPAAACERAEDGCIIHSVPHRRGGVLLGVGSLKGDLLPVVSLAALFGARSEMAAPASRRVLLIAWKQRRFAAPVDAIHGMHRYHPEDLLALPATLADASAYTVGLLSWHTHSVGLLDPERVVAGLLRGVA